MNALSGTAFYEVNLKVDMDEAVFKKLGDLASTLSHNLKELSLPDEQADGRAQQNCID